MITNRGVKVWPEGFPETFCTDHWRCRFMGTDSETISNADIVELLGNVHKLKLDFVKTEHLYTFDGEIGFSLRHLLEGGARSGLEGYQAPHLQADPLRLSLCPVLHLA